MFHNTFEELRNEVGSHWSSDDNPYDRGTGDYILIGELVLNGVEEDLEMEIINHALAMDARAAARPVVKDVAEEVYNSDSEEIIDTGNTYLNKASDHFLSDQIVHGNRDALGASVVYLSGRLENRDRKQDVFSDAAGVSTMTMRDRYEGLRLDIFE